MFLLRLRDLADIEFLNFVNHAAAIEEQQNGGY